MKSNLATFLSTSLDLQKIIVMLLMVVIGVVFRVEGLIDGGNFVDLLKNTVIAFFAVHATQHVIGAVNSYYSNQNTPDDPPASSSVPPGVKL